MKIVIAGGTGLIGSYLQNEFAKMNAEILVISRQKNQVSWQHDAIVSALENADLILNLAGKSINCRHNKKNKAEILESRIESTEKIGNAILDCKNPPKLWINVSASAIYSSLNKTPALETSTKFADDFLSFVVQSWEKSFFDFKLSNTRQVALRTSVVLTKNGGVFTRLYQLTKFGLGGKLGSGYQMFSWIHIEDYYRMIVHLINDERIRGVVNCTSPQPITNIRLMENFRQCLGVKIGIPAPEFAIKIAAKLIGTEPSLILNSCSLYPKVILQSGFIFKYVTIQKAIISFLNKKPE